MKQLLCFWCLLMGASTPLHAATFHVSDATGNDASNGLSWATAKKTIQAAVDAASNNDLVLVANGVYATGARPWAGVSGTLSNRVIIDKALTVQSVNGPEATVILGAGPLGNGAVRCVAMTNGAALEGFTITNGFTRAAGDISKERSGGGVWCSGGGARIQNCTLIGNQADEYGGGMYQGNAIACAFAANITAQYGAGAYNVNATNSVYARNITRNGGGGQANGTAFRCLFEDNVATNGGGGTLTVTLHNCVVRRNTSLTHGGGVSGGILYDCLVYQNRASQQGGGASSATLENCTVVGNRAGDAGGGVNGGTIKSSIVYYNEAFGSPNYTWAPVFGSSCTLPHPGGNNIADDPKIATITNPRLLPGSPCINAGTFQSWMGNAQDIDGEARTNGVVDIGADEYWPAGLTGALTVAIGTPLTRAVVDAAVPFEPLIGGRFSLYLWSYGDGATDTNVFDARHAYAAPGAYPVILTAYNNSGAAAATTTVTVVPGAAWYVQPAGNDGQPGTNWATAKATIQAGVNAADAVGGTVWVNNGVYSNGWDEDGFGGQPNRVAVKKPIAVRSLNGPGATIIMGEKTSGVYAVRCAYLDGDAVLSGFTLSNGQIRSYAAGDALRDRRGAGAWVELSRGTLSNCMLTANHAYDSGGGVYGGVLQDCVLRGNHSEFGNGGGARYATLTGCAVISNTASQGGGVADSVCHDTRLLLNVADSGGAAYQAMLDGCTVFSNRAGYTGGATYAGEASNSIFSWNQSNEGGAVRGGTFRHCTFFGNYGVYGGVAYYGVFTNCLFYGNAARSYGGAVYSVTMHGCTVTGNVASLGGGVYSSTCYDCMIAGNESPGSGGGAYGGTLYNCTLTGNRSFRGGGVHVCTVYNSIMYHNTATTGANHYGSSINASCTAPLPPGSGNIDTAPGIAAIMNPRLTAGSPCIDAGVLQAWMTNATDIDGEPRLNGTVDMGADEFWTSGLTGPLTANIIAAYTQVVAGFSAPFQAVVAGKPEVLVWTFSDGTALSNNGAVSHAFATAGTFSVTLIAANATMAASDTVFVSVLQSASLYVAPGGSDGAPGTNWLAPKATIQAAVDAAVPNATVWVSNGLYASGLVSNHPSFCQLPSRLAVHTPMTVRSVNGPDGTVIAGAGPIGTGAVRGVYLCAGATLSGFTISNGATFTSGESWRDLAGGGIWAEDGATITSCVLVANSAREFGGGLYGGTVCDSRFDNNAVTTGSGGGAARASIDNSMFTRNAAYYVDGGGATESTLRDCIINSNFAYNGGGVAHSVVYRCQIGGNSTRYHGGGAYNCQVVGCVLSNNNSSQSTYTGGGAMNGSVFNSLLINNAAYYGGGAAHAAVANCTIVSNTAIANSGGTYISYVTNSVVYYNDAPVNTNIGGGSARYCCTWPELAGAGNITNEPGLVDVASGDCHLAAGSACIGAATGAWWMIPPDLRSSDLDGQPRMAYGRPDIGAYEHVAELWCDFLVAPTQTFTAQPVAFTGMVAGTNRAALFYRWDFENDGGDDMAGPGLDAPFWQYNTPGLHTVSLVVSNAAKEAAVCVRTNCVTVVPEPASLLLCAVCTALVFRVSAGLRRQGGRG
ncbi:PKD domain-containing protein [bacterium]|nr:PKD domain-containing protein [bacterium]